MMDIKDILLQLFVDEIALSGITIRLKHIRETEEELNNALRDSCFKLLIEWVTPRLKGLDVLLLSGSDEPVITVYKNEKDEVYADTHFPDRIIKEYSEELNVELGKIIEILFSKPIH